jgi:hypothetical protein
MSERPPDHPNGVGGYAGASVGPQRWFRIVLKTPCLVILAIRRLLANRDAILLPILERRQERTHSLTDLRFHFSISQ